MTMKSGDVLHPKIGSGTLVALDCYILTTQSDSGPGEEPLVRYPLRSQQRLTKWAAPIGRSAPIHAQLNDGGLVHKGAAGLRAHMFAPRRFRPSEVRLSGLSAAISFPLRSEFANRVC